MSILLKRISISDNQVVASDPVLDAYSLHYDGHLANWGSSYPTVRTAQSAQANGTSPDPMLGPIFIVGQHRRDDGMYFTYRGFLLFDTSPIPSSAVINNALIILNVAGVGSGNMYDSITIKNGQPTYPRIPVQLDDYYIFRYSGVGGILPMSSCTPGSPVIIELNDTGNSWITKGGTTKLALISQNDNSAFAPAGAEIVVFYQAEAGIQRAPLLRVSYSSGTISGQIVDIKFYDPSSMNFNLSSPPVVRPGQIAGAMVYFKNTSGFTINMWSKFIFKRPDNSVKAVQDFARSAIPLTNNSVGSQGFAYYTDGMTGQWSMDIEIYGDE